MDSTSAMWMEHVGLSNRTLDNYLSPLVINFTEKICLSFRKFMSRGFQLIVAKVVKMAKNGTVP
jgi:hypothetical protein